MTINNATKSIFAGNYHPLKFTLTDADNDNAPLDASAFTIRWALSKISSTTKEYSGTPILEKKSTTSGHMDLADQATGIVSVLLKKADTENLLGTYYYELELEDGLGNTIVVATGKLTIKRNVTNTA